jgi:flagellar basal-body rod modification protein FlgD
MAADAVLPNPIKSATGTSPSSSSGVSTSNSSNSNSMVAQNFDSFLTLLTTQLKNQNPLEPLDTNQFTQQLVQFAQVEQQMKQNDQLTTLVTLQKATQTTTAISFLGATATVDGATAKLDNNMASWGFKSDKASTAVVNIKSANGQLAYTGTFTVNAGQQQFTWDGKGNDGSSWPTGNYTLSVTAKDASGQSVAISTEVSGKVDAVDLTQNPPMLTIGGQQFSLDKIKQVVRPSG